MPPLIRLATRADLSAVLALYRQLRPDDPPLSDTAASRLWTDVGEGRHSCLVIAEVDEPQDLTSASSARVAVAQAADAAATAAAPPRVAGATCMLATIANLASGGRRIGLIEHVITDPRYRRQGLARQVLAYALERAWSVDCCKVLLLSGAQRHEAHGVYEAVGFRGDIERGFVAKPP